MDNGLEHDRVGSAVVRSDGAQGSEPMEHRLQRLDWQAVGGGSAMVLGAPPQALLDLMLACPQPMFMVWGPRQAWLYNDAFVPILGRKHPAALGCPVMEVWAEARADLEPLLARVLAGEPVHQHDIALRLDRHGSLEEAHFAFSYTPVRDDQGSVAGLFGVCTETTQQVLAERRLAHAQERQRRLFERAPGFIAILQGPQHLFEFVNEAYVQLAGRRPLLGRTVREAFPDLDGQGFFELLDEVYVSGRRHVAHDVPIRLDSAAAAADERWLDFIYEPILDEGGRVSGIFVEGHDVTPTHRARTALQLAERHQALLVELSDRFNALDDPADLAHTAAELLGRLLGVSRAGYGTIDPTAETVAIERDWSGSGVKPLAGTLPLRRYGSFVEDLKLGRTVVVADARADPRTAHAVEALRAVSALSLVNVPVTEHEGLVAMLYLTCDQPRQWLPQELAFIRDVAQRTRTAVERRRAEQRLQSLAASLEQQVAQRTAEYDRVWRHSRDLLVVVGADGVFRAVNPAWQRLLGHAPSDVVGRSFQDFVWPEDATSTQEALGRAVERQGLVNFENRYRHLDGSPRWIAWHTAVEGDLVYAYGRDVTAQKEQARALQQAEAALRQAQKLEAMGQLTGGVAHDFNNLLAVVSNNLHLHWRLVPGCAQRPELAAIERACATGTHLTRQLLAFARRQALHPEPVRLQEDLPGLRQVLQATLGRQIEMVVEVAPDTPAIRVDRSELEVAVINLAMNARDAMPDGGVLRIEARPAPREPALVRLQVSDSGHGIPPELLQRVLEPFFTTKGPGQGTGLGLSQVYGFATQAGGRLDIASEPGRSTTVTLWLPAMCNATSAHEPPASNDSQQPGPADKPLAVRVLLVEDNLEVGATTRALLEVAGAAVTHVLDARQALTWLQGPQAGDVDLVLSDIVMPGDFSGVALACWLREHRPGLPVVLTSGYSAEVPAAQAQGFTVLGKPVAPQTLVAAVRAALPGGTVR